MGDIFLARSRRQDKRSDPDLAAWFDLDADDFDPTAAARVLSYVETEILAKHGASMRRTPAGAGMSLLEHMLPDKFTWYTLPDEEQRVIRMNLTQACVQHVDQPGEIDAIFPYDARCAYMSVCHKLPCFFNHIAVPEYLGEAGHYYQHDTRSTYAGWVKGFYKVDVTVPANWPHIGLAPKKPAIRGQMHWDYPRTPGEEWETWIDGAEVQVLDSAGWPYAIRERILFPDVDHEKGDPLGNWIEELSSHIYKIGDTPKTTERRYLRQACRAMALHTIGVFHSRGVPVSVPVPKGQPVPDDVPDWAEMGIDEESGDAIYTWKEGHQGIAKRWDHPEWSAHMWGKWRARTLKRALRVPFEVILHIETDAIYSSAWLPSQMPPDVFYDDGKIGSFRLKEEPILFSKPQPAPATWNDLRLMLDEGSR